MQNIALHYLTLILIVLLSPLSLLKAEIITDGSVGQALTLNGPDFIIAEDLGSRVGNNLFHSFETFNLHTNNGISESATFTGSNTIENVISRITGGELSTINGLLKSEIGNADFYFLNPAGIVFGANAKVDVPAAFHISTADQLKFNDNSVYSAVDLNKSTLGFAQPQEFGFLQAQTASLEINGSQLEFKPASQVSFSAGDIKISGSDTIAAELINEGGIINLTAMGNTIGSIPINSQSTDSASGNLIIKNSKLSVAGSPPGTINMQGGSMLADQGTIITALTKGGTVDQSRGIFINMQDDITIDNDSSINANNLNTQGTGSRIAIEAQNILISNGGRLDSRGPDYAQTGGIEVHAHQSLTVTGRGEYLSQILADSGIAPAGKTDNLTKIGSISIKTPELLLSDHGAIITYSKDYGHSQDTNPEKERPNAIDIQVDRLTIESEGKIVSLNQGAKDAGDINISALENITLNGRDSKIISTTGSGKGADIYITVAETLEMSNAASIGIGSEPGTIETGTSGNMSIYANNIQLLSGSNLYASNTKQSSASIGNIVLNASDTIQFDGYSSDENGVVNQKSGIYSRLFGYGSVGNIDITADQLILTNGGSINAQNYSINPSSYGADITINSRYLELKSLAATDMSDPYGSDSAGWSQITTAATTEDYIHDYPSFGNSGHISINVTEDMLIDGGNNFFGATIRNSSDSGITAGIDISASNLAIKNNGQIFSYTTDGQAGDINLTLEQLDFYGGIITTGTWGDNDAGNIDISATHSVHLNPDRQGKIWQSQVAQIDSSGNGSGTGNAGSISINTPLLYMQNGSKIYTESSNSGDGGKISIYGEQGMVLQNSQITTSSQTGNGGDINIESNALVMDSGFIQANTSVGAQGGDIYIDAPYLLTRNARLPEIGGIDRQEFEIGFGRNIIQAAAPEGNPGTLTISTPEMDINSTISPLSGNFVHLAQLAKDPCAINPNQSSSSLLTGSRGGIPTRPVEASSISFGGSRLDKLLDNTMDSTTTSNSKKYNNLTVNLLQRNNDSYNCRASIVKY